MEKVKSEAGAQQAVAVSDLLRWLYPDGSVRQSRLAASLCARSEAELFGLSAPRFSRRVGVDGKGFVNVRRLVAFADSYLASFPEQVSDDASPSNAAETGRRISQLIAVANGIGDSLLSAPDRFLKDFQILSTDLGLAYGERVQISGTPFVTHTPAISGGMCAQAVCFQATSLLHHDARGIFGVAEITALAEGVGHSQWFDIGGMTPTKVIKYFQANPVGLRAFFQIAWTKNAAALGSFGKPDTSNNGFLNGQELFAAGIHAYVRSGMPVVIPVDLLALWRSRVYSDNGLPSSVLVPMNRFCDRTTHHSLPHAVLVVGAPIEATFERKNLSSTSFLVNDPGTYPFLKISAAVLATSALGATSKSAEGIHLGFIPVTPKEVRLSLLNLGPSDDCGHQNFSIEGWSPKLNEGFVVPGVVLIAWRVQQVLANRRPTLFGYLSREVPNESGLFALLNLKELLTGHPRALVAVRRLLSAMGPNGRTNENGGETTSAADVLLQSLRVRCADYTRESGIRAGWIWLQLREHPRIDDRAGENATHRRDPEFSLWIWDAEKEAPRPLAAMSNSTSHNLQEYRDEHLCKFLLGAAHWIVEERAWLFMEDLDSHPEPDRASGTPRGRLKASLITSFDPEQGSVRPLLESIRSTTQAGIYSRINRIDLYVWMQPDLSEIANLAQRAGIEVPVPSSRQTAVAAMAEWSDRDDLIDWTGQQMLRLPQEIAAIASFVPEISANPASRHAEVARRAVQYLAKLAIRIRKDQATPARSEESTPLTAIEMVCGSCVEAVIEGRLPSRGVQSYLASRRTTTSVHAFIVENLRRALIETGLANELKVHNLAFALELEPGPLFAASSLQDLKSIAGFLEGSALSSVVGFNLDIAHFSLASILPAQLYREKSVFNRIVHAHVAGQHEQAHLADGKVTWKCLRGWRELLEFADLYDRSRDLPRFSGVVAHEFEAAVSFGDVETGFANLKSLIGDL